MAELPNFLTAINILADEKNLPRDVVVETVEAALAAAYKRDFSDRDQETRVSLDQQTSQIRVFVSRIVVPDDELENEDLQISLSEAKMRDPKAEVGTEEEPYLIEEEVEVPGDFGRVAAQTAKQVIIQRLREAEREIVFNEYKDKEGMVLNGTVQRVEGNLAYVDLGKATGVLFGSEQIQGERLYTGLRLKVYLVRVEQATRGPQVVVSRAHSEIVRHLFGLEVPELEAGSVEIRAIAREAGVRSKVAVASNTPGVDPVGTFVGGRGSRVQAVMTELGEEKIDIIPFAEDPKEFIANALSPTKVLRVELNEADRRAVVRVAEDQLSLAIGKQGQNVRLAAKLTGWNIDIASGDESRVEQTAKAAEASSEKKGGSLEDELIRAVEDGPSEDEINESQVDLLSGRDSEDNPTT